MFLKKYFLSFRVGIQESMEYRVDYIVSIISIFFIVSMQIFMWKALYKNPNDVIFTYSYNQILMYAVLAGLVSRLTMIDTDIARCIKSGDLSKFLVKPNNYFFNTLSMNLGRRLSMSLTILSIIIITIYIINPLNEQKIGVISFVLFLLSVILGLMINVLINFIISMTTFWFSEVSNLFSTIYIVQLMLSGGVFPTNIFGNLITIASKILPFQYTIQFPIDILTGKLNFLLIINGLIVQILWIIVCSFSAVLLWKKGLKRYSAMGG